MGKKCPVLSFVLINCSSDIPEFDSLPEYDISESLISQTSVFVDGFFNTDFLYSV